MSCENCDSCTLNTERPKCSECPENKESIVIPADLEVTRENIEKYYADQVHLLDTDQTDDLDLFCYAKCTNNSPEFVKKCRGVVFHGNELVMRAFPYTVDYPHTDLQTLERLFENFSKFSVFDSYEGSLIRVFNFNGRWFLSTHRKLDAFRSKWSSRDSFGVHFLRALEEEVKNNAELRNLMNEKGTSEPDNTLLSRFFSILDPEKQYMFLVLNGVENRIVCQPAERPTMYHVGTFVDHVLTLTSDIPVTSPSKHHFLNIDELVDYVSKIDWTRLQGVICFGPDNTQIKVVHDSYLDNFRVRGNEPILRHRYLQVRMDSDMLDKLKNLYPERATEFKEYENTLYEIAKDIRNSYVSRFIKKQWTVKPQEEFQVMRECHDWHFLDKENNKINDDKVIEVMNRQSWMCLNQMMKHFRTNVVGGQAYNSTRNTNYSSFNGEGRGRGRGRGRGQFHPRTFQPRYLPTRERTEE